MFQIDRSSAIAPYEQLRSQIVEAVSSGQLAVDTRLPSVRALAAELGTAAGTIARAYRELEEAGVVVTRGRNGTFIAAHGDAAERAVQHAAAAYAEVVRSLHVSDDVAIELVTRALRSSPAS